MLTHYEMKTGPIFRLHLNFQLRCEASDQMRDGEGERLSFSSGGKMWMGDGTKMYLTSG